MAGLDLKYDDTGDYIDDGQGFFESDSTAAPAVRHQLLDELGAWVGDLDAGREQRGISGRNASAAEADLESESIRRAMRVLEQAGLIDSTEVLIDKEGPTRFAVGVRTRDTQSGGSIQIEEIAEFGV